jgi:hypothetical protein
MPSLTVDELCDHLLPDPAVDERVDEAVASSFVSHMEAWMEHINADSGGD